MNPTAFHSRLASQLTRRGMFGMWEASGLSPFLVGLEIAATYEQHAEHFIEPLRPVVAAFAKELRDGVYHQRIQEAMRG